jgi:hypothetical protein
MRRLVAAFALVGAISLSVMVPSASAQWGPVGPWGGPPPGPVLESFGVTGGVPYSSTQFFGPGGIQCQYGGYVGGGFGGAGVLGGVGGLGGVGFGGAQVSPFFNASVYGPFGPGPCTPPPALLGAGVGLGGGLGLGCQAVNPVNTLTGLIAVGQGTSTTSAGGVVTFTLLCTGQTFTLVAGQTLATTTLASLLGTTGLGIAGLPGVGLPGVAGLGGVGLGGLGFGGLNGGATGCPLGSTGINLGAVTVCRF